jgi:hypothetical protein
MNNENNGSNDYEPHLIDGHRNIIDNQAGITSRGDHIWLSSTGVVRQAVFYQNRFVLTVLMFW